MFQATMCPSSGETTVFMWHLVLVTLCGWLSCMQGDSTLHTRLHPAYQTVMMDILMSVMTDILMSETCWAHKKWNKIASDIKLVFHPSTVQYVLQLCRWQVLQYSPHSPDLSPCEYECFHNGRSHCVGYGVKRRHLQKTAGQGNAVWRVSWDGWCQALPLSVATNSGQIWGPIWKFYW